MASALFVSLLASEGVENNAPKILGTAGRKTMKFLPYIKYHREARNQKNFIWSVNYESAKSENTQIACFPEIRLLDMLASQNVAGLSILSILQNFVKLACLEVAFPENRLFERLWTVGTHNLQTSQVMSNFFLISCLLIELDIW